MNWYLAIKYTHIMLALVSVAGFIARGLPVILAGWRPRAVFVRVAPHVVDTLLLASGVALMVMSALWPQHHPWLLVKLILLVAYIGLGMMSFRPGFSRPLRIALFVAALVAFAWMFLAARHKSPMGLAVWLGL